MNLNFQQNQPPFIDSTNNSFMQNVFDLLTEWLTASKIIFLFGFALAHQFSL